ncbi:MAG: hypothetical protein U1E26_06175 [Coriobacteriia bacterium]|nr:hypothetical protein [Coriobacteriia bacterium]
MGERKRTFIWLAVVAVVVVILFGVPAYLTAQPEFFKRYPVMAEKYGPWAVSTHLEAGCDGCHVPPRALPRAVYRARLIGEFYLSLAFSDREPDLFETPGNEACLVCHNDLRSVSPEGDLQIPHRAHVTILKMECVECHDYLVHEKNAAGVHTPSMDGCMRCHDGDTAKDACTACHTEKAAPKSHQGADWLVVHAERGDDPDCEGCHSYTEDWCGDCHRSRPRSHGTDWRAVHRDAVAKQRSCEACHDGKFCVRCHGEVPTLNLEARVESTGQVSPDE